MSDMELVEILLVEDSETDAEMTLRALKRHALSNHVTWVKDGAEALDFVFSTGSYSARGNRPPKLVLLDLKMPKVDGIEVLRRMKADERTRAIPVVILTSSAEESDIVRSYKLGVNSFITKPVTFTGLVDAMHVLGRYWLEIVELPPAAA